MSKANENTVETPVSGIGAMLEAAKAFQTQMAEFAAQSAAARKELQDGVAALDAEKAAIDGPHKEYLASLDGLRADALKEYKEKVDGILAKRQELAAQLQQLVAAGVGAPVKAATTVGGPAVSTAGTAPRNSGVKEFVFGLLESDPALSPKQLAEACEGHYGNASTTEGTCNGLKVAFKKLNAHLYG